MYTDEITANKTLFAFDQIFKFFVNITAKEYFFNGDEHSSGYYGLSYQFMFKKINETVLACNGTFANKDSFFWPNITQLHNMNHTWRWYQVPGTNQYSLYMRFAWNFINTSFLQCVNKSTTDWVNEYKHSENINFTITMTICLLLGVLGVGTFIYCKCTSQFSNYTSTNDQRSGCYSLFSKRRNQTVSNPTDPETLTYQF